MTEAKITELVDEGLSLAGEITKKKDRLKEINEALTAWAEANPEAHIKLKDEEREGTQFLCAGTGKTVAVVFTSDLLKQKIAPNSKDLTALQTLAGDHFGKFYKRTVSYESVHGKGNKFDGKAFRAVARELLEDPEKFLSACVRRNKEGMPISLTRIAWSDAKEETEEDAS